jgi:hypothetical protein
MSLASPAVREPEEFSGLTFAGISLVFRLIQDSFEVRVLDSEHVTQVDPGSVSSGEDPGAPNINEKAPH